VYHGPKANFGGLGTRQISRPGELAVGPYAAKPTLDWPLLAQRAQMPFPSEMPIAMRKWRTLKMVPP